MPSCLTLSQVQSHYLDQYGVNLPMSTLYSSVENNRGPRSFKVGRRIFVRLPDAEEWIESQMALTERGAR